MFYNVLGRITWYAAKRFLRHRFGPTYLPKPLVAGAALAAALTALLLVLRREAGRGD